MASEKVTSDRWVRVNPPHWHHQPDHLEAVIAEMRRRGPPEIRAFWDEEARVWHAREGTHRLRAALLLGVAPVMVSVAWPRARRSLLGARHHARLWGHWFERVDERYGQGQVHTDASTPPSPSQSAGPRLHDWPGSP